METSADGQNWHRDARYFYYPHGPLERVELGEHLVQGMDYAYTLQGWLKGINGDRLNPTTDMGRDGDPSVTTNPNLLAGRDAYALSLGYYGDVDYKGIASSWDDNTPANIVQRPIAPIGVGGTMEAEHVPLYNGNIAHTVNTLQHFGLWTSGNGAQGQVLAQVYRYDQLNRLKKARGVSGLGSSNTWAGVSDLATNKYRSQYEYDANGNIQSVERYDADQNPYDAFTYNYEKRDGRVVRNRLYQLYDDADAVDMYVNEPGGAQDIAHTPTVTDPMDPAYFEEEDPNINANYNYGYDALGNLVRDTREGITGIDWTVAGKVRSVTKATGPSLAFAYGASGQRTLKQVSDPDLDDSGYREHYIRDAQGNIMATYRFTNTSADGVSLKLTERPVYGSSRLGSLRKQVELYDESFDPQAADPMLQIDLNYELTDHLGNVCAVVTGRLLDGNGGGTPKQADLLSAQGYEAFGSLLPGRNFSSGLYRLGFQGQERDDELHGTTGSSINYEYRMHDSRVGRFLSIDPLSAEYPHNSPYAFSENRLIDKIELEGLESTDPPLPSSSPVIKTPTSAELSKSFGPSARTLIYDFASSESFAESFDVTFDRAGQERVASLLLRTDLQETPRDDRPPLSGKVVQIATQLADFNTASEDNPMGLVPGTWQMHTIPEEYIPENSGAVLNPGRSTEELPSVPLGEGQSIVYTVRVVVTETP